MLFGGKFFATLGHAMTRGHMVLSPIRYTNDMMAAILTAWGVPTTVYGDPVYGKGPVPGLFA
jgi:hypothetical protein